MLALMKLIIEVLTMFKLMPKSRLMTQHDVVLLEDQLNQINKINIRQSDNITKLNKDFKDMEKQYQTVFLKEQETRERSKTLENQVREANEAITTYERDAEIASQEFLTLQDQVTEATELSSQLKEALTKWTS